jgi:hypothetical protein
LIISCRLRGRWIICDFYTIIPSCDVGVVREIETIIEWNVEGGWRLGPNKSAIIIADTTRTISILYSRKAK